MKTSKPQSLPATAPVSSKNEYVVYFKVRVNQ